MAEYTVRERISAAPTISTSAAVVISFGSETIRPGVIYSLTARTADNAYAVGVAGTDANGTFVHAETTGAGHNFEFAIDGGSLTIKPTHAPSATMSVQIHAETEVVDSSISVGGGTINNTQLPMSINDPLFAAAFGTAIRTRPGVEISLLPYLINPVGTGVIVHENHQGIGASQVIVDQSRQSITINKDPDEGEYSFDLRVAQ